MSNERPRGRQTALDAAEFVHFASAGSVSGTPSAEYLDALYRQVIKWSELVSDHLLLAQQREERERHGTNPPIALPDSMRESHPIAGEYLPLHCPVKK